MKALKMMLVTVVIITWSISPILAKEIKKGDIAYVAGWEWIEVKNLNGIKNGNCYYGFDTGSCGIKEGGILKVVGIKENSLLVRYYVEKKQYGTNCPSGTLFFISKKTFSTMTEDVVIERKKRISLEKKEIKKFLKEE